MSRWLTALLFVAALVPGISIPAYAAEPFCPGGSNPSASVIFCDDFEDGTWLDTWADKGFEGVQCGGLGATDNCSAWTGTSWGFDGLGWDGLYADSRGIIAFPAEFYFRFYYRQSDPFTCGIIGSKILRPRHVTDTATLMSSTPTAGGGGTCAAAMYNFINDTVYDQNQGNNINFQAGRWYLVEMYFNLNTPGVSNGTFKMWVDDASVPIVAQTLRMVHTNVLFRNVNILPISIQLSGYWQTLPRPTPPASGQHIRWDQLVVSTAAIGPVGLSQVSHSSAKIVRIMEVVAMNWFVLASGMVGIGILAIIIRLKWPHLLGGRRQGIDRWLTV